MANVTTQVIIPKTCPFHFVPLLDNPEGTITEWGFHVLYCPKVLTGECDYIEPVED